MTFFRKVSKLMLLGALPCFSAPVYAATDSIQSPDNNAAVKAVYEEWDLPGDESMGMVGLGVSHELSDYFSMGIGTWMAVRGERGGFITLGIDGTLHVPLTDRLGLESGVFVGAGGGRGGYNLSGGGLMLRTHAALTCRIGSWGSLGAGVSYVDFPNSGSISSVQPFVSLSLPFYFPVEGGMERNADRISSRQDPPRKHSLAVIGRDLQVSSSTNTLSGGDQDDLALLGIEWRTYFDETWYAKLEMEGAASRGSTGYMQILTGVGARLPLADDFYATADLSVGGGGGGDVDTGGGLLFDASAGLQFFLTDNFFAGVSGGYLTSFSGGFESTSIALNLGYEAGRGQDRNLSRTAAKGDDAEYLRVRLVNQTYFKADDHWRTHHVDEDIQNLGVQIDYFLDRNWYLSGQGLAAYDGNAGAYMTGLLGAGIRKNITDRFYLNAEALAGAAGGGGVAVGSGLVWQGNLGLGYDITPAISVMATAGRMEAFDGDFRSNVLGLSLGYNFNSPL
ncbi:MAG: hypothetical protein HGA46_07610 [Chlorobiaceae bacterium]|jgi:hypothetical protein|nr:hypothetical protein [Chlorobiaceae bacterium]